jgi:hypothetical protein
MLNAPRRPDPLALREVVCLPLPCLAARLDFSSLVIDSPP